MCCMENRRQVSTSPGLVMLLRRHELGPDALRPVAPRAVEPGVVPQRPKVPLPYHVTLMGVVGSPLLQQLVVPHVPPQQHGVAAVDLPEHADRAGRVQLEEALAGLGEEAAEEGDAGQSGGVGGFEPEEAEDCPPEAEADRFGVPEGKIVRIFVSLMSTTS